jgi:hypothetical protein
MVNYLIIKNDMTSPYKDTRFKLGETYTNIPRSFVSKENLCYMHPESAIIEMQTKAIYRDYKLVKIWTQYVEHTNTWSIQFISDVDIDDIKSDYAKNQDKYMTHPNWRKRALLALFGYKIDVLAFDDNTNVKLCVAYSDIDGLMSDVLYTDNAWQIRKMIAKRGFHLKDLVNDPNKEVRRMVAKKKYGLDILIKDFEDDVRMEVIKLGYNPEALVYDSNKEIRDIARQLVKKQKEQGLL